jgi:hypothetical protein
MTRQEITGIRELIFSKWIRNNLPDSSTGFMVTDLDFILYNYKAKKIMFLEVKTRNKELPFWQRTVFNQLSKWVEKGIDTDWDFFGFHLITFSNTFFNNGIVYLDGKKITEKELIDFLTFKKGEREP